jgi:hypothetical protein
VEALREADELRPYDVSDMKKAQPAAHAERQLAGSGWLPAILRIKQAVFHIVHVFTGRKLACHARTDGPLAIG